MEQKKAHSYQSSLKALKEALEFYEGEVASEQVKFLALSKAFEVAVEYAWKELKSRVENEGLEAYSPKDVVRQAARAGMIEEAELWIEFINARNSGVHDYFGLPKETYLKLVRSFLKETERL